MKISSFGAPVALFAAAALTLSACAANETANPGTGTSGSAAAGGTLAGKGASSMSAAQQKWIADYQSAHPGVTINYSPDGSGAGREAFTSGAVQYAGSDRPFKDEEMGAGKFGKCTADSNALNLPIYVVGGGVASGWEAFGPTIFEELRNRCMVYAATAPADALAQGGGASAHVEPGPGRKTIVTRALLGSDAGLFGAARLPMVAEATR